MQKKKKGKKSLLFLFFHSAISLLLLPPCNCSSPLGCAANQIGCHKSKLELSKVNMAVAQEKVGRDIYFIIETLPD